VTDGGPYRLLTTTGGPMTGVRCRQGRVGEGQPGRSVKLALPETGLVERNHTRPWTARFSAEALERFRSAARPALSECKPWRRGVSRKRSK